jgi:hypothetical protein
LNEQTLKETTAFWKDSKQSPNAEKAMALLRNFDGMMRVDSAGAAFCGAFLYSLSKNLFADELGGTESQAYQSLLETFLMKYSALHDHLTDRCKDSPFWGENEAIFLPKPFWMLSPFWKNAAVKTLKNGNGANFTHIIGRLMAPCLPIIWTLCQRPASNFYPVTLTEVLIRHLVTTPL